MTREQYGKAYEAGFSQLVRRLMALGVTSGDAEDVAQQAWLRGWERLSQLRDDTCVLPWVNTIGRNISMSARRRKQLLQLSEIEEPLRRHMNEDAAIDAARALDECSASDRQLLSQYYLLGCSGIELARARKVTTAAIHCALLRARRRAAMHLSPRPAQQKKQA